MQPDRNNSQPPEGSQPAVNIGNASNPSSDDLQNEPLSDNQILTAGAEKYLREVASVEDYPDANDDADMDKAIEDEKNSDENG
jgi:hypothetical protein